MTPEQKLKWMILLKAKQWGDGITLPEINAENIDSIYSELEDGEFSDTIQDARNEVRQSGEETKIPAEFSRHYECDSVAAQAPDGSWIGWNYWHGGGKHGEPEAIDWMDDAYDVDVTEEEKTVTVRTFKKRE